MIKILGLGPGAPEDLTIGSINIMKSVNNLYLRTEKHPNVPYLSEMGIKFKTFDSFYDNEESFDAVYKKIAEHIVNEENVVYAVPGHPLVAEKSVSLILEIAKLKNMEVEIIPAVSFIDAIINVIQVDPINGLKIIDGLELGKQKPDLEVGNIITQVYSKLIVSEAKIKLMDYYEDEQKVYLIRAAGVKGLEKIEVMPLYMIDRVDWVDYLTSIYIPRVINKTKNDFNDLLTVMEQLRSEDGCPWDKEQTQETLKRYLIEEAYEVIEAIDKDDMENLSEELGDVLLQVVFHSQIAKEFGEFDIKEVIHKITDKMIKRHTHVFGDDKCDTAEEVLTNWEEIKRKEKNINSHTHNLKLVPKVLPGLIRSYKVQEKAAKVGFDWDKTEDAILKIHEELNEFLEAFKEEKKDRIAEELGDLIFSIVNVARFLEINPEFALTNTIEKFITRFEYIETKALKKGKNMEEMSLAEMDLLWNEAKNK
jgi:tetrapyrrole methylase family protein / MazG family protein